MIKAAHKTIHQKEKLWPDRYNSRRSRRKITLVLSRAAKSAADNMSLGDPRPIIDIFCDSDLLDRSWGQRIFSIGQRACPVIDKFRVFFSQIFTPKNKPVHFIDWKETV